MWANCENRNSLKHQKVIRSSRSINKMQIQDRAVILLRIRVNRTVGLYNE